MKKGKTSKLDLFQDAKCYYGSVDATELKSIYLVLQTWVKPTQERDNWERVVGTISRTIKHKVLEVYNKSLFKEHFIVDLDLRTSGIKVDKASFLNLEITFFTKENIEFKSENLSNELNHILKEVHNNVLGKSKYFTIQYSKNKLENKNFEIF
jgi:hypothetical protein